MLGRKTLDLINLQHGDYSARERKLRYKIINVYMCGRAGHLES